MHFKDTKWALEKGVSGPFLKITQNKRLCKISLKLNIAHNNIYGTGDFQSFEWYLIKL